MRNANLLTPGDIFDELPEYQRRMAAYMHQARMYVITNIDAIKERFAEFIYKKLCEQNPDIQIHYGGNRNKDAGEKAAIHIIISYTILYEDCIILFNPNNMEPAVVEDVYLYTDYNINTFEEKVLLEYIEENRSGNNPLSQMGKKAAMRGARVGGGYAIGKTGDLLLVRANRLSALAQHYDGGHRSRMRLERSFKGKAAQKEAWKKMLASSQKFEKGASAGKMVGGFFKSTGKGMIIKSFRPITIFDGLMPVDFPDQTMEGPEKNRMSKIIPKELSIYCKKNNNFQKIVNERHYTQKINY